MEKAAVFVKNQVETDVFEGQERDGRRRERKDGGRTEEDRGRTFPDYNPYTIRRCRDCGMNSGKGKLAFVAENEVCEACRLVRKCGGDSKKSRSAKEKIHYRDHEMAHLLNVNIEKKLKDGRKINVRFDKRGNDHLYSDAVSRSNVLERDDLKTLDALLKGAIFTRDAKRKSGHNNPYEHFYYFKARLHNQNVLLNVGKKVNRRKDGKVQTKYILYSVSDIK